VKDLRVCVIKEPGIELSQFDKTPIGTLHHPQSTILTRQLYLFRMALPHVADLLSIVSVLFFMFVVDASDPGLPGPFPFLLLATCFSQSPSTSPFYTSRKGRGVPQLPFCRAYHRMAIVQLLQPKAGRGQIHKDIRSIATPISRHRFTIRCFFPMRRYHHGRVVQPSPSSGGAPIPVMHLPEVQVGHRI